MGDADQGDVDMVYEPEVPDALPNFDNAIVRALRDKLERTNRIRRFKDYKLGDELGKGTYAKVHRMTKLGGGGQVFAVKLWNEMDVPNINLTHLNVLSELNTLLKVNDGWHACDELDRAWCPLVQLHGLFLRPRGLLMEQYGESLYDVLRNDSKRAKFYADGAGVGTDGTPLFRSHLSVASNVASACRFLHDKGMMHRDLKDANVLVDGTYGRWRAKLSDFGTTADVRSMLQGQVLGTLHAMAPEVLKTVDPVGQDGVTVLADARAADVYAYGILLCALWDNGQDPLRHLKATDEWDEVQQDLPHMEPLDQVHVALQMLMCVEPFRYGDEGLRPAKPQGMPPFFWDLMKSCLVYKADKRPTFLKICEEIKAHAPAVRAPAGGPEANLRVIAVVRYKPELDRQSTMGLVFRITVSVEDRNAELTLTPSGYVSTDGEAAFAFPFAARLGQHITLSIGTPVPGAELFLPHIAEFRWVGRKSVQLPLPMAIGATQKVSITLTPNWAEQPLGGSKVALLLDVKREHESKERMLGVLSALLAAPQRTFHRLVTPGRMPHELRSDFPVEYDVMLSYRESETGKAGSNFAFRLQEALELKNLNVFAYANLAETDHWMSPQTNGVASCRVFMPIFSPEYGDLDKSPWSAAELMTAAAYLGTPGAGLSAILPVWHSGTYPPNADTRFLMRHVRGRYVPDAARYNNTPACDMRYKHVWLIVHEVLKSLLD